MLRIPHALDEASAIALAKQFLSDRHPRVVSESVVNAERIAGVRREQQREALAAFVKSQGQDSDLPACQAALNEDHWCVRFFAVYSEGTAGTVPPTMVRVYDSDHRVEMAAY